MNIHATYCSAEKSNAPGRIPAIERYKSRRIQWVNERAHRQGETFFILSGKHGLIKAEEEIAYYDYLLTSDALKDHIQLLSQQLSSLGIRQVTFFARPTSIDPNVLPYVKCIKEACQMTSCRIDLIKYPLEEYRR